MIHNGDTSKRGRTRSLLRALLIVCVVGLPCRAQQPAQISRSTDVRDLVDGGTKRTNELVTVQGCLVKEFEIVVLQPCGVRFDQFSKYSVWLDDILQVTLEEKQAKESLFIAAQSQNILRNGRGGLWKLDGSRNHPHAVTVEGEFQIGSKRRFGHLNFYTSRFIVHRYLEASDTK